MIHNVLTNNNSKYVDFAVKIALSISKVTIVFMFIEKHGTIPKIKRDLKDF